MSDSESETEESRVSRQDPEWIDLFNLAKNHRSLDTVISSTALHKWRRKKLTSDHLFSRFHEKFWGKNLGDEERQGQESQSSTMTGPVGGEDNEDELDKQCSSEDDDIIPGCYLMDLGFNGFENRRIWIRADYIRIFDYVEEHYNKKSYPQTRAPSVVVTGQPGIGKSVWQLYAIRRCLAQERPVIWHRNCEAYLFVKDGVFQAPTDLDQTTFKSFIWTLVDSDESRAGVPEHYVTHGTRMFVIYTSSPQKDLWKPLHKTTRTIVTVMNPWTRGEISRLATALTPEIQCTDIDQVFDCFGPTPRLCIEALSNPRAMKQHKQNVLDTISMLNITQIEKMLSDTCCLTMDSISDRICLIRRKEVDEVYGGVIVSPITPAIQSRLAARFRIFARGDQVRLYENLSRVSNTRQLAGFIFEAVAQRILQEGCRLHLIPMVHRAQKKKKANSQPQWHSSHIHSLETLRLKIKPRSTVEYPRPGPSKIKSKVFYVPKIDNEAAMDSFILLGKHLYIFQFTIAANQLIKFFNKCKGVPPREKWRFVFVIPPEHLFVCPQPRNRELSKLQPYTTVMHLSTDSIVPLE